MLKACLPSLFPLQPKYLKRWVDLSAVWFKHSKARGNLRASVEAAGLQCECPEIMLKRNFVIGTVRCQEVLLMLLVPRQWRACLHWSRCLAQQLACKVSTPAHRSWLRWRCCRGGAGALCD